MHVQRLVLLLCVVVAAPLAGAGRAVADADPRPVAQRDVGVEDLGPPANERAATGGAYLPLTLAPAVGAVAASVVGQAGYDGARRAAVSTTFGEVRAASRLALRAGVELGDTTNRLRPIVGARLGFLAQERHGVDGSLSVFYRAEGLTEPEGEIETVLSVGRRFARATVIGNAAYGQDPEGSERDGELRAAVLARVSRRLYVGVDGRWRFDLGSSTRKLLASNEATSDLDAGPVAAMTLGPVTLTAHAGLSVVRRVGQDAAAGAVALGGLGTSF
jgi:hypothetical protein